MTARQGLKNIILVSVHLLTWSFCGDIPPPLPNWIHHCGDSSRPSPFIHCLNLQASTVYIYCACTRQLRSCMVLTLFQVLFFFLSFKPLENRVELHKTIYFLFQPVLTDILKNATIERTFEILTPFEPTVQMNLKCNIYGVWYCNTI